jgi:hypothetical protein
MLVLKGLAVIWGIALLGFLIINGQVAWVTLFAQAPVVGAGAVWEVKNRKNKGNK